MTGREPMRAWVFFEVGGIRCDGEARCAVPAQGGTAHPGWRLACTYDGSDDDGAPQAVDVLISQEDYERIVSGPRLLDANLAHEEALRHHIRVLTKEAEELVHRVSMAPPGVLAREWVENVLAPTPAQWALLAVDDAGMVTVESLARAGCFPPPMVVDRNFVEWRVLRSDSGCEELDQEIAKATAPYKLYIESEPLRESGS